jgi:pimeloyl-ACP methyl ester carboxylesterase
MRVLIHGAYASKNSFNYLKTQLPVDDEMYISYNAENDLINTIQTIKKKIEKNGGDEPIDLIGHSLGGVISVVLYHIGLKNVRSIITMSAPFGGITNNILMKFWFPKSIYGEFHKLEREYSHLLSRSIKVPYLFYVTTQGSNPLFLGEKNDGVVTVVSQKSIPNVKYSEVSTNHYEILMSEPVCADIRNFLKNQ